MTDPKIERAARIDTATLSDALDKVQLEAVNVVINIGDARVNPGDILRGDSDGVVVIPKARELEVLEVAEGIEAAEARIRAAVTSGVRLDEARRQQGYHRLQTRRSDTP
jgi:4-hydroxy-4-methyl-2-oxoglutarate aldolase